MFAHFFLQPKIYKTDPSAGWSTILQTLKRVSRQASNIPLDTTPSQRIVTVKKKILNKQQKKNLLSLSSCGVPSNQTKKPYRQFKQTILLCKFVIIQLSAQYDYIFCIDFNIKDKFGKYLNQSKL